MMKISLQDVGKRFNREWVFRHFNYHFIEGEQYAITGANGSGKSTLLQVIAGAMMQSEGKIDYKMPGNTLEIPVSESYKYLSIAAPYLECIEEMTAKEFLHFHSKFKKITVGIEMILEETGLAGAADKQIRYFSSGMKQRLKLAQAFFSDARILLLDEPTTNLDTDGIQLYHSLIKKYTPGRLLIISSNVEQEFDFCSEEIKISDYK